MCLVSALYLVPSLIEPMGRNIRRKNEKEHKRGREKRWRFGSALLFLQQHNNLATSQIDSPSVHQTDGLGCFVATTYFPPRCTLGICILFFSSSPSSSSSSSCGRIGPVVVVVTFHAKPVPFLVSNPSLGDIIHKPPYQHFEEKRMGGRRRASS